MRTATNSEASNDLDWWNQQSCHETRRNSRRCLASQRPTPRPVHKTRGRVQRNLTRSKNQGDLRPNRHKHKGRAARVQVGPRRKTNNAIWKPGSKRKDTLRSRTARGFLHRCRAEPRRKSKRTKPARRDQDTVETSQLINE